MTTSDAMMQDAHGRMLAFEVVVVGGVVIR